MNRKDSIKLSGILRHNAHKFNIKMDDYGYVNINDLIKYFNKKYTLQDIEKCVEKDNKNRFKLKEVKGQYYIKANQGHSIDIINEDLKIIKSVNELPHGIAVHGTYYKCLKDIIKNGLSKMDRTHIHMCCSDNNSQVISGMRSNCQVMIYIDVALALSNGIKFYLSENNVILSDGINGIIDKKYFDKVVDINTNEIVNIK